MINKTIKRILSTIIIIVIATGITLVVDFIKTKVPNNTESDQTFHTHEASYNLKNIPKFKDKPYVVINNNKPSFTKEELERGKKSFQEFSDLDELMRCGTAFASIGKDIMPTEERESIGMIKPTGWQTVRYDDLIEDKYLYNRCHLIGYQLTGQNANEYNLITGTRYLNISGMLPFENQIADYVKNTGNHVLYSVTPIFEENNLVASGILLEAESVEDNGEGISFCVYCYNEQPGIEIDHSTGDSKRKE